MGGENTGKAGEEDGSKRDEKEEALQYRLGTMYYNRKGHEERADMGFGVVCWNFAGGDSRKREKRKRESGFPRTLKVAEKGAFPGQTKRRKWGVKSR